MKGYVVAHFADEEKLMTENGLLDDAHKKIHEDFLAAAGPVMCPLNAEVATFVK